MPYADPDKRREVKRRSERQRRAARGEGLRDLREHLRRAEDLPEPPSRDMLLRALGVQAMRGNVPAIRLLLEEYRREPFAKFDEIDGESVIDRLAREANKRRQRGR